MAKAKEKNQHKTFSFSQLMQKVQSCIHMCVCVRLAYSIQTNLMSFSMWFLSKQAGKYLLFVLSAVA